MTDEPMVVRRPIGPPPLALRFAAVLVVPLLLYALVATGQKALDNYRLNQETEALRAEVVGLRAENVQLQQAIEQARTDTAIETIAREQLGMVKPGDHPIVLIGQPSPSTSGSTSSAGPTTQLPPSAPAPTPPVWRQWFDYMFG